MIAFIQRLVRCVTFGVLLAGSSLLHAQYVSTTTGTGSYTTTYDFEFRSNAILIAKGANGTGTLYTTDQGAGTRLLWFPNLAAFRAGRVTSTQWNTANIGNYSTALGSNNSAGDWSTAAGSGNTVTGIGSLAMGLSNDVFGSYSAAFGSSNLAYQNCTFALGHGTEANGRCSVVMGFNTEADSDTDFVCGRYNVGGGTADSFVSTDPLFEVGNGTSSVHANAFTIYKNGTAAFAGYVNIAPGSNIPMFTGN